MSFDPNKEVITTQGDLKKLIITACELRETELQKQITELQRELDLAKSFHDVAVADRNLERTRVNELQWLLNESREMVKVRDSLLQDRHDRIQEITFWVDTLWERVADRDKEYIPFTYELETFLRHQKEQTE